MEYREERGRYMDKIHAHNIQHANIQQPTHNSAYRSRKGAKGETEKKKNSIKKEMLNKMREDDIEK